MRDIDNLELRVEDNGNIIRDNQNSIRFIEESKPPLGTILAWVSKATPEQTENIINELPTGWMKCDGGLIASESPWAGYHTPNLNGEGRFLRGGSPDDSNTFHDDMFQVESN